MAKTGSSDGQAGWTVPQSSEEDSFTLWTLIKRSGREPQWGWYWSSQDNASSLLPRYGASFLMCVTKTYFNVLADYISLILQRVLTYFEKSEWNKLKPVTSMVMQPLQCMPIGNSKVSHWLFSWQTTIFPPFAQWNKPNYNQCCETRLESSWPHRVSEEKLLIPWELQVLPIFCIIGKYILCVSF